MPHDHPPRPRSHPLTILVSCIGLLLAVWFPVLSGQLRRIEKMLSEPPILICSDATILED